MAKIEVTGGFIRIPNPKFTGDCLEIRTIVLQEAAGIKALFCLTSKKVKTYLFDVAKWTVDEARAWVKDHAKELKDGVVKAEMRRDKDGKLCVNIKGQVLAVASEEVEDREGEVLSLDGWELSSYKSNPVLLWMHNRNPAHNGLPIGSVKFIGKRTLGGKKKLVFEPQFDDSTEFNRTVKQFYENGVLNSFSVGFLPKEREGNRYIKQELLEISAVPVPALASAQVIDAAKELGISEGKALQVVDFPKTKATVPFRAYDPAPESRAWDSAAATARARKWAGGPDKDKMNWNMYKELFTWFDSDERTSFGVYKLPHHDVTGGEPLTIWRGVVAAMGVLLGARGGVDVPESDKRRIYNHLARHYRQFDKEPPAFRFVLSQELRDVFEVVEDQSIENAQKEMLKLLRDVKRSVKTRQINEKKRRVNELVEALKLLDQGLKKSSNLTK